MRTERALLFSVSSPFTACRASCGRVSYHAGKKGACPPCPEPKSAIPYRSCEPADKLSSYSLGFGTSLRRLEPGNFVIRKTPNKCLRSSWFARKKTAKQSIHKPKHRRHQACERDWMMNLSGNIPYTPESSTFTPPHTHTQCLETSALSCRPA